MYPMIGICSDIAFAVGKISRLRNGSLKTLACGKTFYSKHLWYLTSCSALPKNSAIVPTVFSVSDRAENVQD